MLIAVSAGGLLVREYVLDAAVFLSRHTAVGGMLMVSLAPLVAMLVTVAMLLLMQRSAADRVISMRVVIASLGSMIVPFLVVYEHYGNMSEDLRAYGLGVTQANVDDAFLNALNGVADNGVFGMPDGSSPVVVGTVVGSLIVRSLAGRAAASFQSRPQGASAAPTAFQMLGGYADVVWVVLGVVALSTFTDRMSAWWSGRVASQWVSTAWERLTFEVPFVDDIADLVVPSAGQLASALIVGIVVPISWLTFGLIVYGTQAADKLPSALGSELDPVLGSDRRAHQLLRRMTTRVSAATVERAWKFSLDPGLRFGPLLGGLGMIRRAAFTSGLAFCLAYVAASESGRLVWVIARWMVGPSAFNTWSSLEPVLEAVASIIIQVLTACLLAAAAGSMVRAFARDEAGETSPVDAGQPAGSSQ
jgi:hypothetical protein